VDRDIETYKPLDEIRDYVNDIVSGRVASCASIRGACERHLRDLERQHDDEFEYYFDEQYAEAVCLFYPMVARHSIGKNVGQRFYLAPWQAFALGSLFGWKKKSDDTRRFTKSYISVARKNGKSTFAAALCLFMAGYDYNPITGTFESVAQVVIAASKKEQAERVTMAEAVRMRAQSPMITQASEYKNRQINFTANSGTIVAVGSDRAFDGLNPSMVVIDELHAFRSIGNQAEFYDTMKTGSGARSQPLFIITTTAGSTTSALWISEWKYATGVARGDYEDDTYFSLSYELDEDDDPLDESKWIKANPCLGVTLEYEFLRDQARQAATDYVALNRFTRYHGNRLVSSLEGAFSITQWGESSGELSDWREADCIGAGVDLGGRNDLAAFGFVARFKTGEKREESDSPIYRYEGFTRAFIASDTPRDLRVQPFSNFIEDGILRVTRHPITELEAELVKFAKENGCEEVAFDPYQAQRSAENLENQGLVVAAMPQTTAHFNAPIEELRLCLADGRFTHNGCPLLKWAIGNAVVDIDKQNRMMLSKRDSAEKIDPAVALLMAFSRAMFGYGRADSFLVTI